MTCGRVTVGPAGSRNVNFLILNLELVQSRFTLVLGFVCLLEGMGGLCSFVLFL